VIGNIANSGTVQLQNEASLSTTGRLSNSGNGGSSLTIGGTLSHSNHVQIGDGALSTTVSAQNLTNTGRIDIDGGNTAQAVLSTAAAVTWTGTVNLNGNSLLEFGGTSGITAIGANSSINLFSARRLSWRRPESARSVTARSPGSPAIPGRSNCKNGASLSTTGGELDDDQ
jgi:hypothetical protein